MKQRMRIWRLCVWPYRSARGCSVDLIHSVWGWRFWPMGMQILGLWGCIFLAHGDKNSWTMGWRLFAVSCFFLEYKTVFLESEDAGTGNSVRGADRLLHKPNWTSLSRTLDYLNQATAEAAAGLPGFWQTSIVALPHRLSSCCWRNIVKQMSWRRACFFLSEIASGQGWVMGLSCWLEWLA